MTHGLAIPKSNWANRIETPPFRAYPVTCGITFTFGGVKINPKAQVLNSLHEPIKGLYASGDILGLFFHNYPSFTGQTRNAVCSTWFCKHERGAVGQRFWHAVRDLLIAVEERVALRCLIEGGLPDEQVNNVLGHRAALRETIARANSGDTLPEMDVPTPE